MTDDHELAAGLAADAGALLVDLRESLLRRDTDPREIRDLGDARAQELLAARLADARPDDAVLSEEARDDRARLDATRVWIVDPLDGTREYSEGRDDWAVHVALWREGELVAGAVALPGLGLTLSTGRPHTLPAAHAGGPRLLVSRTRPPAVAEQLAQTLDGELVAMGSAGAKAMAVVRGEAEIYAHAGGQYEWDSAAPVAVARAAGLHTSRLDGSPLRYNREDAYLPDLLICRPELASRVLAVTGGTSR